MHTHLIPIKGAIPAREQQRVAVAKRVSGETEIKAKFKAPSLDTV